MSSVTSIARYIHSLCFIRDDVNFCLGPSLIFSNIFPSPVPYSSLIFQVNLDRLGTTARARAQMSVYEKSAEVKSSR